MQQKLVTLPAALRQAGYQPPRYHALYLRAVEGAFPATQLGRVWHWQTGSENAIAKALDLMPIQIEDVGE